MRVVKWLFIVILGIFLVAPAVSSIHGFSRSTLGGVVKRSRSVPLTFDSIVDRSFQKSFEVRFTRWLSIFATLVKTDNQISLWLFRQLSSNPNGKVVLGNRGHLIERAYLPAFNRQKMPKKSTIISVASKIARLEKAFATRGKKLVVLISTNKPNFYPDLVPSWYRIPGIESTTSAYDIFIGALYAHGVKPLDSRVFLRQVEDEAKVPLFEPTGTHWNEFAACKISARLAEMVSAGGQLSVGKLECSLNGLRARPTEQDMDLLKVTNILFPDRLIRPAPRVVARITSQPPRDRRPRVLFVGTSFCWELLKILSTNQLFSDREFLYYFKTRVTARGGKKAPIDRDRFDVAATLDRFDAVVLEVNEAFVHRAGYGFVERALKALREERGNGR